MKNKWWIWIIAGVVVIAGVIFFVVRNNNVKDNPDVVSSDPGTLDGTISGDSSEVGDETDLDLSSDGTGTGDLNPGETGNSQTSVNPANVPTGLTGQYTLKNGTKFEVISVEDVENDGYISEWISATFGKYAEEAQIKEAAELIVSKVRPAKPKAAEITTQFYITKEDAKGMTLYNNAIVSWGPVEVTYDDNGKTIIPNNVKYDYYLQMVEKPQPLPDKIAGISYSKAKEFYTKYISQQDNIQTEGMAKYPEDAIERQKYVLESTNTLLEKLCKEYGLEIPAVGDIILAALNYKW